MSNSYAQPILRTTELSEGLSIVERLLGIANVSAIEVDFDVRISSRPVLSAVLAVLSDAEWWTERDGDGASDEGGDDPSAHLPISLRRWAMPLETVEPFLKAVGDSPATVRWDFAGWPEAPEVGLGVCGTRGAFLTLCVNVRDLDLEEPATVHTVFVHVKQVEAERAPWLASQVGLRVIGDLVTAPY